MATSGRLAARRFLRGGMWFFLATAIGTILVVGTLEVQGRWGSSGKDVDPIDAVAGLILLFLAGMYWLFVWSYDRRAAKEKRLLQEGALVGAELSSIKYSSGSDENLPSLRIAYRFTLPDGRTIEGRQTQTQFDVNRKALPPAGSKLLVLYVDDTLHAAL